MKIVDWFKKPSFLLLFALVAIVLVELIFLFKPSLEGILPGQSLAITTDSELTTYQLKIAKKAELNQALNKFGILEHYQSNGVGLYDSSRKVYPEEIVIQLTANPQAYDRFISQSEKGKIEIKSASSIYQAENKTYTLFVYFAPQILGKPNANQIVSNYLLWELYLLTDPPRDERVEKRDQIYQLVYEEGLIPFQLEPDSLSWLKNLKLVKTAYAQSCSGERSCSQTETPARCNDGSGSCSECSGPCDDDSGTCTCAETCVFAFTKSCKVNSAQDGCYADGCGITTCGDANAYCTFTPANAPTNTPPPDATNTPPPPDATNTPPPAAACSAPAGCVRDTGSCSDGSSKNNLVIIGTGLAPARTGRPQGSHYALPDLTMNVHQVVPPTTT